VSVSAIDGLLRRVVEGVVVGVVAKKKKQFGCQIKKGRIFKRTSSFLRDVI
jgi:hypothetical protein